jgi:hypothetical protein
MMKKQILNKGIKLKRLVEGDKHYFFGYYNNPQISKNGKFALSLGVDFIDKYPNGKNVADIILVDLEKNTSKKIAETRAWNWQQGCMLQWFPDDYNSKIIFNDFRENKFISVILEIKTKKEKIIPYPVYSLHPSGEYALTLNFSRLNTLRTGYGYNGLKDNNEDEKVPKNDGIYFLNLKTNKIKIIISLEDLYKYDPLDSMKKGKHWVDHIDFNPSGEQFCFFHRWEIEGGLFHTRLFTSNLVGKKLYRFADSGFYSHFTWKNNKELLGWCSQSEKLGYIRQGEKESNFFIEKILPVYRKIIPKFIRKRILPVGYFILNDSSKISKKINIYSEDGHPSFSKNKRCLITDTYPNKKNYRKLILYDWEKNKRIILGEFYSLPDRKYMENTKKEKDYQNWGDSSFRADLHPRWDFQGNKITFDSVHEGKRNCYLINLNKFIS